MSENSPVFAANDGAAAYLAWRGEKVLLVERRVPALLTGFRTDPVLWAAFEPAVIARLEPVQEVAWSGTGCGMRRGQYGGRHGTTRGHIVARPGSNLVPEFPGGGPLRLLGSWPRPSWRSRRAGTNPRQPGERTQGPLHHFLPARFLRIRHYGFLANCAKQTQLAALGQFDFPGGMPSALRGHADAKPTACHPN